MMPNIMDGSNLDSSTRQKDESLPMPVRTCSN